MHQISKPHLFPVPWLVAQPLGSSRNSNGFEGESSELYPVQPEEAFPRTVRRTPHDTPVLDPHAHVRLGIRIAVLWTRSSVTWDHLYAVSYRAGMQAA